MTQSCSHTVVTSTVTAWHAARVLLTTLTRNRHQQPAARPPRDAGFWPARPRPWRRPGSCPPRPWAATGNCPPANGSRSACWGWEIAAAVRCAPCSRCPITRCGHRRLPPRSRRAGPAAGARLLCRATRARSNSRAATSTTISANCWRATTSMPCGAAFPIIGMAWRTARRLQAGKDMYGEKPITRWIDQGVRIRDAVRRYSCVFQTGTQQRSSTHFRHACELAITGYLGKVHTDPRGRPGRDNVPGGASVRTSRGIRLRHVDRAGAASFRSTPSAANGSPCT